MKNIHICSYIKEMQRTIKGLMTLIVGGIENETKVGRKVLLFTFLYSFYC